MRHAIHTEYQRIPTAELSAEDRALEQAALAVAEAAYAPYSHFRVGAAVRLEDGTIVMGSNQENAAYPSGICAERTALFWAGSQYPDLAPDTLCIVAINESGRVPMISPCGACRQVLLEVATRHRPYRVILAGAQESILLEDCRALLPFAFTEEDLHQRP